MGIGQRTEKGDNYLITVAVVYIHSFFSLFNLLLLLLILLLEVSI